MAHQIIIGPPISYITYISYTLSNYHYEPPLNIMYNHLHNNSALGKYSHTGGRYWFLFKKKDNSVLDLELKRKSWYSKNKKLFNENLASNGNWTLSHAIRMISRIAPYSISYGAKLRNSAFPFIILSIFHKFLHCNYILNCKLTNI